MALRAAPSLCCPSGSDTVEGVTHGYIRHGTTRPCFAALSSVLTRRAGSSPSARRATAIQEFLSFLKHIDANVPPDLDIHLGPSTTVQHPQACQGHSLARGPSPEDQDPLHPHLLRPGRNQVEIWFNIIGPRRPSAAAPSPPITQLKEKILRFTDH